MFLARTGDSGASVLTLHFSRVERIAILKLAATLNMAPEQLIRQIVLRHLPLNAGLEQAELTPPWL